METALLQVHNIFRWVILLLLVLSIIRSFAGWRKNKELRDVDAKLWLFTMISAHITLLIGLYLLFFGRYGVLSAGLPDGVHLMKDKFYRFFWIEHPVGMVLAIIFITLARGMAKKQIQDPQKYKKAFWLFLLALIIIATVIPWPGRDIVGRSL
jgi:Na+/H+-dicarboxylate symporter